MRAVELTEEGNGYEDDLKALLRVNKGASIKINVCLTSR